MKALAANIRAELARADKTQADLAAVLGLSQAAVSRRLAGRTPMDIPELEVVADWLDVSLAQLLSEPVGTP